MTTAETSLEKSITAAADQICLACEGTGSWDLFDDVPCKFCGGTGFGFFQGTD
jgi:DnaJ-class molecular chaperone